MRLFVSALLLGLLPLPGSADILPDLSGRSPKPSEYNSLNPYNPSDPHTPRLAPPPAVVGWSFAITADDTLPRSRVDQVAAALKDASKTYSEMGFTAPNIDIQVLLKDDPAQKTSRYSPLFGEIILPIKPKTPEIQLKADTAHGLFHALQNTKMNAFDMAARKWFIEASAEYAAGYKVYPGTGQAKKLIVEWFQAPLTSNEDSLNYQSSHFLHYLMFRTQTSLHDLFQQLVDADGVLPHQTLDSVVQQSLPDADLISLMRDFTAYALFDASTPEDIRVPSDKNFLRTRIEWKQLVSTFQPYKDFTARQDTITIAEDYGVRVWALDLDRNTQMTEYKVLLSSETALPESVRRPRTFARITPAHCSATKRPAGRVEVAEP